MSGGFDEARLGNGDSRTETMPYVLVVDDAPERFAIAQRLSALRLGWIATAEPGLPLGMAATWPKLAIVVPEMPGGMRVITELHEADERLPIIAYTSRDRTGDAELRAIGVYQVVKRGNLEALIDEVRSVLDLRP